MFEKQRAGDSPARPLLFKHFPGKVMADKPMSLTSGRDRPMIRSSVSLVDR